MSSFGEVLLAFVSSSAFASASVGAFSPSSLSALVARFLGVFVVTFALVVVFGLLVLAFFLEALSPSFASLITLVLVLALVEAAVPRIQEHFLVVWDGYVGVERDFEVAAGLSLHKRLNRFD